MDWSSKINKSFLDNYPQNVNKDLNDDGKIDSKDKEKFFEKSGIFDSKELTFDDLITLSNKKDVDGDGVVSDEESNLFEDLKDFLYEKIAQNINRDKDLSLEDLKNLEETVRGLSGDEKDDVGNELERVQNRMISNITAQFFVTNETQSYKDSMPDKALDVWKNQDLLSQINETENNPFNAKMETLLNKLDKKVEKSLSETYSAEQIEEFKKTQDKSALDVEDEPDDEELTDYNGNEYDNFDIGTDKYTWKSNAKSSKFYLFKNGEKFTGKVTYHNNEMYFVDGLGYDGLYEGIYYNGGLICTGIGKDGNYYKSGKPVTGDVPYGNGNGTLHVENGKIIYQDKLNKNGDIERIEFKNYGYWDENNKYVDTTFSKIITFNGTDKEYIKSAVNYENGKINSKGEITGTIVSTETYVYNSVDDTYTVTIHYEDITKEDETELRDKDGNVFSEDGMCAFNGKLYKDGKVTLEYQQYNNKWYVQGVIIDGSYNGILYVKGVKLTGVNEADNLYYVEGKIEEYAEDSDGKLYQYGSLAQGICKYNNETKYYENGIAQNINQNVVDFTVSNSIINAVIKVDEQGNTTIKGKALIKGSLRDVEVDNINFNINGDISKYNLTYNLSNEVLQKDTISIPTKLEASQIILKGVRNDTVVPLSIDKAKELTAIDNSVSFADADGNVVGGVYIYEAINDNMTKIMYYNKNNAGDFEIVSEKIAFASIKEIQEGKPYNSFDNNSVQKDENDGSYIIGDTFSVLFNYDDDKTFTGTTITFINGEDKELQLGPQDIFEIKIEEAGSTVTVVKDNKVVVYGADGTIVSEVLNLTNELKAFAKKLDIKLTDISNFEQNQQDDEITSITIKEIKYSIDNTNNDKIILSNDAENREIVYKKSGNSYLIISKKMPCRIGDEDVIKTQTWDELGNLSTEEIIKNDNTKLKYVYEKNGILLQKSKTTPSGVQTIVEPNYDANWNITDTLVTEIDGNKITKTTYLGDMKQKVYEEETEGNKVSTSYFNSFGDLRYTEVKENNIIKTTITCSYNDSHKLTNKEIKNYYNNGNIDYPIIIVNAAGAYAEVDAQGNYKYYGKNGVMFEQTELDWANKLGVLIEKVETKDGKTTITGLRYDYKPVSYENYSYSNGKYSFTETLTLSTNATAGDNDDIILVTVVQDDVQISATLKADGKEYNVNVNGSSVINNIDNAIATWEADDYAHKAVVSDVIFDGVSRQRIFTRSSEGKFEVTEIVALATIEDLKDESKSYVSFGAANIKEDADTVILTPDANGEIIVYYGKDTSNEDGHSAGDYNEAYKITLPEGVTSLTITKKDTGYEITDSKGAVYEFTSDGGYTVTKDGQTTTYSNEGVVQTDSDADGTQGGENQGNETRDDGTANDGTQSGENQGNETLDDGTANDGIQNNENQSGNNNPPDDPDGTEDPDGGEDPDGVEDTEE